VDGRKGIRTVKNGGWWRWALLSQDGVAPSRMVGVFASVSLPLHHNVQKFSSGTGSPGWSQKKAVKRLWWFGSGVYFVVIFPAFDVIFSALVKRLAGKSISEMTCFVSSEMYNLNSVYHLSTLLSTNVARDKLLS